MIIGKYRLNQGMYITGWNPDQVRSSRVNDFGYSKAIIVSWINIDIGYPANPHFKPLVHALNRELFVYRVATKAVRIIHKGKFVSPKHKQEYL